MTFKRLNKFSQRLFEIHFELFSHLFLHCLLRNEIIQHQKTYGYTHDMIILLRNVIESDLPIFFEQQLDPEATAMAAFPSRDEFCN